MNTSYQMSTPILTPVGKKKLEQELVELKKKRIEIAVKIKDAKELGDLAENAEYHAAKEEQGFAESRIAEIESLLKSARIVKPSTSKTHISIGSQIKVKSGEDVYKYEIVGMSEAEPALGKISASSPLGGAFLGTKKGDKIEVQTPAGKRTFIIMEIE